jgi:hypothetical protein
LLINRYGIDGAAMAWLLRSVLDFILLLLISSKFLNGFSTLFTKVSMLAISAVILILAVSLPGMLALRLAVAALGLAAYYYLTWQFMLSPTERDDLYDIYQHLLKVVRSR